MLKGCYCQPLDPLDWQEKEYFLEKPRYFYRVTTRMALHSPISYPEDVAMGMVEAKTRGYIIKQGPAHFIEERPVPGRDLSGDQPSRGAGLTAEKTAAMPLPLPTGSLLYGGHQGASFPDGRRNRQIDPEFQEEGAQSKRPLLVLG